MYRSNPITVRAALLMVSLMLTSAAARADGIETSFSGYGTAGGTFTSNGQYSYVHNPTEFAGASNSFDVGLESRVGVQATVQFSPQWSVTAQEEAKLRGSTDFDPGTQWLFVQYQPHSDLKLRVGRVALSQFFYSDVIDVGYAVPWFRPPNEVYDGTVFYYVDGLQALWQHAFGPVELGLEVSYGDMSAAIDVDGFQAAGTAKDTINGAVTLSWGNVTARYAQTDLRIGGKANFAGALLNITVHDYFHCTGLQYDNGKAIVMGEFVKRDEDNVQPFNKPLGVEADWYVAAGWRFGPFTPLVTYSSLDLLKALIGGAASYHTWGGSLRYDVVRNLDLKLQVNRAQANNAAYFLNPQPIQQYILVYSFGADFVF